MRFEYMTLDVAWGPQRDQVRVVSANGYSLGGDRRHPKGPYLSDYLNRLGSDEWEVTAAFGGGTCIFGVVILKRRVSGE